MAKCKRTHDQRLVGVIVAELKKGGALNEPRRYFCADSPALSDYVPSEVQRSIDSVRMRQTFKLPTEVEIEMKDSDGKFVMRRVAMPKLTLSDYRKAATALHKVAFTEEQRSAIRQLEAVRQEPPEHADPLKYHCAKEAYFLMECFSAKEPTDYYDGPFQKIAAAIYEAVTGQQPRTMKRSCALVLRERPVPHRWSRR